MKVKFFCVALALCFAMALPATAELSTSNVGPTLKTVPTAPAPRLMAQGMGDADVICPGGALYENEPTCYADYNDLFNAGCNNDPNNFTWVSPSTAGITYCGESGVFTFGASSYRDTDWYEVNTTSDQSLDLGLSAEFDMILGLLDGSNGCPVSTFTDSVTGAANTAVVLNNYLPAGKWWIFVSTADWGAWPCGTDSEYVLNISAFTGYTPLPPPTGLTCTDNGDGIALAWTNNYAYTAIEVWVNGTLEDTLAAGTTTYKYYPPAKGYYCVYICGTEGVDFGCSEDCCMIWGFDGEELLFDFEADDGGFIVEGTGLWEWGVGTFGPCADPLNNVWATDLDGTYTSNACWELTSSGIDIPADKGTFICVEHCYDTELGFDGGNVWFTTDDYWYYLITPNEGYDAVAPEVGCHFFDNRDIFTGNSGGWVTDCWTLINPMWHGETVFMRFVFGADETVHDYAGWSIDNISMYVNQGGTVSCDYIVTPLIGTVPFVTNHDVTFCNEYLGLTRRLAGRINVVIANGNSYSNWKSGWSNITAGSCFNRAFNITIPAQGNVIGANTFTFIAEDVTPSPYNQPPHPPSGDTCTVVNTVIANAP